MGASTSGLQNSANQLSSESSSTLNQLFSLLGGMQGEAGLFTGLSGPLAGLEQSILGPGGAGGMAPQDMAQFMNLAMNPSALASLTGINAGQLTGNATNYLSNTGGTNLAQGMPGWMAQLQGPQAVAQAGPQAEAFYRNEMQQGINPQYAQNAQNQLSQQFNTASNTLNAQARPGQNTGSQQQQLMNSMLGASANLGGQLAGEGQQFSNAGAQGLMGAAGQTQAAQSANIGQQAGLAQGLDSQTMGMLLNAAQLGTGYNQTVLGNAGQAAGMGQSALSGAQGVIGMGNQLDQYAGSQLGQVGEYLGNQGLDYTQLASQVASQNNPLSEIMGALGMAGGLYGDVSTGGFGGFGGKGQMPGGGGAGNPNDPGGVPMLP